LGVVEQVADHAAQQLAIARDDGGLARRLDVVARGFLGRDRQQVDRLVAFQSGHGF
jgi:hypothetical protein